MALCACCIGFVADFYSNAAFISFCSRNFGNRDLYIRFCVTNRRGCSCIVINFIKVQSFSKDFRIESKFIYFLSFWIYVFNFSFEVLNFSSVIFRTGFPDIFSAKIIFTEPITEICTVWCTVCFLKCLPALVINFITSLFRCRNRYSYCFCFRI